MCYIKDLLSINIVVCCVLLTEILTVLEQGGGENSLMHKLRRTYCAFSIKIISSILSSDVAWFFILWQRRRVQERWFEPCFLQQSGMGSNVPPCINSLSTDILLKGQTGFFKTIMEKIQKNLGRLHILAYSHTFWREDRRLPLLKLQNCRSSLW